MISQHQPQLQTVQQHSRSSTSDDDSGCALEEYAWCPPGLKAEQVRQFFKCFPEEKVPYINSIGEKYRTRMLEFQLPAHDSDPKHCRALTEDEKNELRIFNEQQRYNALGRGIAKQLPLTQSPFPCRSCKKSIESGSICVYAERAGRHGLYHPQCFTCIQCHEFLVNLIYFYKDDQLHCGRHHAELYKPRCTACDEIIFSDECTEAEGYSWHMDHFCCSNCQKRLGGERYVMRQNQPFCLNCFETMYAEYCDTCGERIETDQAQMAHESQHWHATDACFYCYTCRIPLHNRAFFPRYGALFCSNDCALQRNKRLNATKLTQQQPQQTKYERSPDVIPITYSSNNPNLRTIPGRSRSNHGSESLRSMMSRSKDQGGYISDGAGGNKYKRETTNGYLSDGAGTRRYKQTTSQYLPNVSRVNYGMDEGPNVIQSHPSPESILKNRHETKSFSSRSRSREPIQFYNDFNLEQLDRHGATLEIARSSASKSSRASLPDLSQKPSRALPTKMNYTSVSPESTFIDTSKSKIRTKQYDSNEIMYPISRPKSIAYSTTSNQFPRSRSLNGSGRFAKQHHVRFVDDENEKIGQGSPSLSYRSKRSSKSTRIAGSSSSSSSSSEDEDDQENLDSIYRQYDIHGNRIQRSIHFGTKISYVDECGLSTNPSFNKNNTRNSNVKEKKSNGRRKKKDCIIS